MSQLFRPFDPTPTQTAMDIAFWVDPTLMAGESAFLRHLVMGLRLEGQQVTYIAPQGLNLADLPTLGSDFGAEPPKTDPRYYYRPWKTILTRTVADGGACCFDLNTQSEMCVANAMTDCDSGNGQTDIQCQTQDDCPMGTICCGGSIRSLPPTRNTLTGPDSLWRLYQRLVFWHRWASTRPTT